MSRKRTVFSIGILIIILVILVISAYTLVNAYKRDVPIAQNGILDLTYRDLEERGFVSLKGDFNVYDGIYEPEELDTMYIVPKHMTFEDIRLYSYPKGTLTAKMIVNLDDVDIDGIIIEEIYTANKVFINGRLISSTGYIGNSMKSTIKGKKSVFLPLDDIDDVIEVIIQVGNYETISGQFERNIYIGDYKKLQHFYNLKLFIKLLSMGFFITVSFFLFGLYIKNRKYSYLLTLSIAGLLNFYFLLTHFEPIVLFNPKDKIYLINSWLHIFPAIFTQFLCAFTVILFYKIKPIYNNYKKFLIVNSILLFASMIILIIFDKVSYPIYIGAIIYTLCLMLYASFSSGKRFISGDRSSLLIYFALLAYVTSFGLLMYITLNQNSYQTLGYYNIYMILPQLFLYLILCYMTITHFSKQFSVTEISETELSRIVEEKAAELKTSYERLQQKDKQRAEMLVNISHDLRSPMTVVKGYVELLKKDKIDKEHLNQYMDTIYHKITYVTNLINELLTLANLENNDKISMEIDYVDAIIDEVVSQYNSNEYDIVVNMPKDIIMLCNDKNIYRLFNNLLDNAIEHSDKGVNINITGIIQGDNVIVEVRDTGKGISENDLTNIFDRFSKRNMEVKEDNNHFGLGLAICKAIVKRHNGNIVCKSEVGKGTTFIITLPLYEEDKK